MLVTDFSTAEAYQRLGAIIGQVQSRFIRGAPPAEVFEPLLTDLLGFTGSEYGFVAELMRDPGDQRPFLRIRVLTDISWDDATRALFEEHRAGRQPIEFHNLKTLFGAAVTSGKTVISNDPQSDPRSGGRPGQHPPLRCFLGVPLHHGGEMVGIVGLANRFGGYDDALVAFLEPLFASVASIMGAVRLEAAREAAEEAVREGRVAAAAAQRANAAKTEFLSRMSHELRTPLNAVLGFAQLLRLDADDPLTPAQTERVRHIETAGGHLLAMIDEVLDLSRIESGSLPMSLDTVSLTQVVGEAVALVAALAAETGVRVQVERGAGGNVDPARVRADHLRLRQVLVNLISNAIKFNRRGGSVNVRWPASADGKTVRLEVSDTGRGMAPQQLAHLFEPFNRLGAEATGIRGTGIGLVISQRLVHSMGGELEVSSEPGVGSSFRVLLPTALHDGPEAIGTVPGPLEPAVDAAARMRTVLYADDNALNVELVVALLATRPELRVVVARSGHEAIATARRDPPDLCLLDMHLGDLTGLEVLQVLATDPVLAQVPCVALSADAMPAAIESAKLGGFKDYLTKPLNVRAFLQCLDEVLAAR